MPADKNARVRLTADDKLMAKGLASAQKRLNAFGKSARRIGQGVSNVLGGLKTAVGLGGIGALATVGVGFADSLKDVMNFEEALTRLSINSRGGIGPLGAFRDKVNQVSSATGVAREDVLGAAAAYVTLTGDAKGASDSMELFAKISKGSGASLDDISAAAAALTQNLKIDPKDFEQAFSILISGGKAGAIELKDMASLMAGLAPLFEQFKGGGGTAGLANLGAALQLTRQGFGSAEEAATGLESLMGAIVKNAAKLEAAKIQVFDKDANGKKTMRNFQQIVEAIGESKLAKDPTLLVKALGRKEAYQAYVQLTKVRGAWNGLATSTANAKDVSEDYATFQESTAGRLQAAWNELKNQVAETFTPERIQAFVQGMEQAVKMATDLLGLVGDIGTAVNDFVTGGDSTDSDRGNAMLKDYLAGGGKLEDFANMPVPDKEAPWMKWARRGANLGGISLPEPDTDRDVIIAGRRAYERKKQAGKRRDIDVYKRGDWSPTFGHDPESDSLTDARAQDAARQPVGVGVLVSVKKGDLKAELDNSPAHRAAGASP